MSNFKRIIMEKFKTKLLSFFSQRANAFFVVSSILALIVCLFLNCGMFVFTIAAIIAISSILLLRWFFRIERMDCSKLVLIGWGCIIFTVFTLLCKLCEAEVCGVCVYVSGFTLNLCVIPVLICYIPKISVSAKLVSIGIHGYDIFPWAILPIMIVGVLCGIGAAVEIDTRDDALFAKEEFVPVKSWTIEVNKGRTVYIVTIPQGKIAVYPWNTPEIRDINSKTQVRVLLSSIETGSGINTPTRIEIRN